MNDQITALLTQPHLHLKTAAVLPVPAPSDRGMPPLSPGHLHEWFLSVAVVNDKAWHPPLTVMAGMAKKIMRSQNEKRMVWIGRRCWPAFQLLKGIGADAWLERSVFLDPCNDNERYWAIGQTLRCPGVALVIADGGGMSQTVSRRLQLAAESGNVLAFIARPPWESDEPSYADTRWQVHPRASSNESPGWNISLLRCRRQQHAQDARQNWTATWAYQVDRGTGTFDLFPGVGRGIGSSPDGRAQALSRTA